MVLICRSNIDSLPEIPDGEHSTHWKIRDMGRKDQAFIDGWSVEYYARVVADVAISVRSGLNR